MKVGTDGVLLGAWACPHTEQPLPMKCLDIGTGTGLIALMLAQRFPTASITGIDIDDASIEQAKENVEASPFRGQILIKKQDFNIINLHSNKYELIVSNPPFYKEETLGGKQARDAARHTTSLPFNTLVENASKMLSENGVFSVIIPYAEAPSFISICAFNKLYLHRRLMYVQVSGSHSNGHCWNSARPSFPPKLTHSPCKTHIIAAPLNTPSSPVHSTSKNGTNELSSHHQ